MVQIKAFDPFKLNTELKRHQPSEETLRYQEELLNKILIEQDLEAVQKESVTSPANKYKKKKKKTHHNEQPINNQTVLIKSGEVKALAKIEINLKFSELPKAEPAENKKVKLFFKDKDNDENEYASLVNRRSWNKAVSRVEGIEASDGEWTGVVAGKLKVDGGFLTVVEAGIQIFEKKKKEEKEEQS